jgi:hypothetical protein
MEATCGGSSMSENKNAKTPADGPEYERGFVEGMQRQMQLHVNRVIREEPTAWRCQCGKLYTVTCISSKPAKREWVGLTDEEREFLLHQALRFYDTNAQLLSFIKTVEEKLKEKNT